MIYGMIVKKRIRQSFDQVNNHKWETLLASIAPAVHHRCLGAHAIGGERHDRDTLRRWFERLARVFSGVKYRAAIYRCQRLEAKLERGDNPKVADTAFERPEQVGVFIFAQMQKRSVGGNDVGSSNLV